MNTKQAVGTVVTMLLIGGAVLIMVSVVKAAK